MNSEKHSLAINVSRESENKIKEAAYQAGEPISPFLNEQLEKYADKNNAVISETDTYDNRHLNIRNLSSKARKGYDLLLENMVDDLLKED